MAFLTLFALLSAAALGGWLFLRSTSEPGPDPAKARLEVQRAYDKRWPGRVNVDGCSYYRDPEGSIFDWYDCRISIRCKPLIRFSVPRASDGGRSNYDVLLPEGTSRRQLFGCRGESVRNDGNRRLRDGSWFGKVVRANVARRTLTFAPACRLSLSGRWVPTATRGPRTVVLAPHAELTIYYRPNGDAAAGHSQTADWKLLADVAEFGRLPSHPPGWFITLRNRAAVSIDEDSGISSSGTADRRRLACVWSRATRAFVNARPDPPLLVPWNRVGDMALGEPRASVERAYGSAGHRFHVLSQGNGIVQGYYGLHGSRLFVTYEDDRVNELDFTTPYYETKSGFGVGSAIPLGPCHTTPSNRCEHRWHGFVWNAWVRDKPCSCWVKVGVGARSLPATTASFRKPWFFIYTRRGHVRRFHFALKFVD